MIVAVSGGKGGVGKSTTAWNLGRELDAVVVDADLTSPDLPPGIGPDLHDVLAGRTEPLEAVVDHGPVMVLPCGRTLAGARASRLETFGRVLRRLERKFGRVVVDCPAGLARDVGTILECATLAVLVTAPTRAALVDLHRTNELASALQTPVASVVLNGADPAAHEEVADRLGQTLDVEVTLVERQQAVADAQACQCPVREYEPGARAVDSYRSIADQLVGAGERLAARSESG